MLTRETSQDFGDVLREHRLRKGRTQKQVADFSTISVRAIRDLEQGRARRPRRATVDLLADALRLDDAERSHLVAVADRTARAARSRVGDMVGAAPPSESPPFVGRGREVEDLVQQLVAAGRRVLSVTGAPGAGKSRLALVVAERVHGMARVPVLGAGDHRQDFAASGSHRTGGLGEVLRTVPRELFAPASADQASPGLDALALAVGDQPALLLLDVPRYGAADRGAFDRLLAGCPGLRVLATGRRPLGHPAERVVPIGPLDADHASRAFLAHTDPDRAEDEPPSADVTEICRILDGLPGALSAVASWLAVYDQETLLSYLRDDPLPFLIPLPGGGVGREGCFSDTVLEDSSPAERALLGFLCASPDGEDADGLAQASGLSPAESGRALNDLLIRGLVLRDTGPGALRFRALNLVRALQAAAVPTR
ncbi:helix-turn-helix domain-containing protein [Nocardiopsis quinghaiensis]|uniref:helix-turn-helix domain-containing protein n=1 Tax=Nocardiopsis quinghaiensis TaxID=464995 RepID=UPI0016814889|nr:helix-turn-helix domain-containing protein [Nocardiopsis quinghaiensis]